MHFKFIDSLFICQSAKFQNQNNSIDEMTFVHFNLKRKSERIAEIPFRLALHTSVYPMTTNQLYDHTGRQPGLLGLKYIHMYLFNLINPFPHIDVFWRLNRRQPFENKSTKEKLLKMSNFSFCYHVFNSFQLLCFHLKGVYNFVGVCFQSRLLQICCIWERDKIRLKLAHSYIDLMGIPYRSSQINLCIRRLNCRLPNCSV